MINKIILKWQQRKHFKKILTFISLYRQRNEPKKATRNECFYPLWKLNLIFNIQHSMFNNQLIEVVIKNELCKNNDAAKKLKIEYSVLNIEYSFFSIKQNKENISKFNVHFFVSTKKRTKENDPKRMLLPALFAYFLFFRPLQKQSF